MNEEELLDKALDIFHRMRMAYCCSEEGHNGLLNRWPDFIEEIEDLKTLAARAEEERANQAIINAMKKKGTDQCPPRRKSLSNTTGRTTARTAGMTKSPAGSFPASGLSTGAADAAVEEGRGHRPARRRGGEAMTDIQTESYDYRTMQGKTGEEQAKRAIKHVLGMIRDHAGIGWYMGAGTHSFDLLTEAAATLFGESLDKVRAHFMPVHPRNPKQEDDNQ